ncbi:S10 family serine carboxypeptidase-like protein [Pelagerythrobacter aerophilus]|uniref:S10 family serine carboxypeptidase-like protein n=1 Tax=Pelagerythrobacter aerophilus TaxID=2306995 RepID=UPI001E48C3E7|nr:peptidase S10 [Pelagerythrobacter aerophilus]
MRITSISRVLLLLVCSWLSVATAAACPPDAVETGHEATLRDGTLPYLACAGTIAVDNGDDAQGRIFYTAYLASSDVEQRPVAFVWNGGPGADSRLLHFAALGPVRIRDSRAEANPDSPLAVSDLVFVDPVGTGFSRAESEGEAAGFYSTTADIAATTDFILSWLETSGRADAPIFLVGESFGTWRAAGVAEALADQGRPVAGIALISGGIPLGDMPDRHLMRALSLPNRAATALAHGKLAPEMRGDLPQVLQRAERFARAVYAPALVDPAALSPKERAAVRGRIAAFQGLSPEAVDPETLWVSPRTFRTELLGEAGQMLDVFDMRSTDGADPTPSGKAVLRYYREHLRYAEGRYAGIEVDELPVGAEWQYDQAPITPESLARAMAGEGPPSPSQPWTLRAMAKMPDMRTFVAAGLYDSLNSCAANEATVAALPTPVAARFALHCYPGGHMMYDEPAVAVAFGHDIAAFLGAEKQE